MVLSASLSIVLLFAAISISFSLPEYRRIGCFSDSRDRALPKHLGNFGSEKYPQRKCYLSAKNKGYKVFAMQNNGECWSGPDAHLTYDKHGQSGGCRNNLGGGWANDVFVSQAYKHVGCFEDSRHRSLRHYFGESRGADAVHKCYEKAVAKGFHAFGVQNGGECWTSVDADHKYNMYGPSSKCKNGKGGGWANDVYFLYNYSPLYKSHGCYKDKSARAMGSHQGTRRNRNDSIEMCYEDAVKNGYTMFGMQYGGECWSGDKIEMTYSKYGEAGNCKDGLGGGWSNDVYSINYYRKGCYKDASPKAMGEFLGTFSGPDAVMRCYQLVKEKEYDAFGVQNGGHCYSSKDADKTFDKYGAGSDCKDGKGGPSSNDVYFVPDFDPYSKMYPKEGCFKDSRDRALPEYLGEFHRDAVNKCFKAALAKNWRYFGVQNRGECWSGPNAAATYSKHGVGKGCHHGLGGQWHNDVYRIAFLHKGCYVDDPLRALPDVIGIWPKLQPNVALTKCFEAVKAKNVKLKVFGIQYDGECYSSPIGEKTYKKYGPGSGCTNGVGASWVNDVYYINSTSQYTSLGCWKDEAWRRFELLGTWREDSYLKCYEATIAKGYKGFGLQYGGECWSSTEIDIRYNERGKTDICKNGRGSDWANDIYLI